MNIKSRAGRRQLQLFNTLWCLNITLLSPRHFSSKSQIEAHCLQIIIYSVEQHFLFIMQLSPHLFSLYNQLNLHMFSYCMIIIGSHIFSHHLCWFRPINPQKNHGNPSIFCRLPKPGGLRAARDLLQKIQVATPTAQAELKVSRKWWDNGVWMCLIYLRL